MKAQTTENPYANLETLTLLRIYDKHPNEIDQILSNLSPGFIPELFEEFKSLNLTLHEQELIASLICLRFDYCKSFHVFFEVDKYRIDPTELLNKLANTDLETLLLFEIRDDIRCEEFLDILQSLGLTNPRILSLHTALCFEQDDFGGLRWFNSNDRLKMIDPNFTLNGQSLFEILLNSTNKSSHNINDWIEQFITIFNIKLTTKHLEILQDKEFPPVAVIDHLIKQKLAQPFLSEIINIYCKTSQTAALILKKLSDVIPDLYDQKIVERKSATQLSVGHYCALIGYTAFPIRKNMLTINQTNTNYDRNTLLHCFALFGLSKYQTQFIREILKVYQDEINQPNSALNTPFHLAMTSADDPLALYQIFIEHGGKFTLKNNEDLSPLDYLLLHFHPKNQKPMNRSSLREYLYNSNGTLAYVSHQVTEVMANFFPDLTLTDDYKQRLVMISEKLHQFLRTRDVLTQSKSYKEHYVENPELVEQILQSIYSRISLSRLLDFYFLYAEGMTSHFQEVRTKFPTLNIYYRLQELCSILFEWSEFRPEKHTDVRQMPLDVIKIICRKMPVESQMKWALTCKYFFNQIVYKVLLNERLFQELVNFYPHCEEKIFLTGITPPEHMLNAQGVALPKGRSLSPYNRMTLFLNHILLPYPFASRAFYPDGEVQRHRGLAHHFKKPYRHMMFDCFTEQSCDRYQYDWQPNTLHEQLLQLAFCLGKNSAIPFLTQRPWATNGIQLEPLLSTRNLNGLVQMFTHLPANFNFNGCTNAQFEQCLELAIINNRMDLLQVFRAPANLLNNKENGFFLLLLPRTKDPEIVRLMINRMSNVERCFYEFAHLAAVPQDLHRELMERSSIPLANNVFIFTKAMLLAHRKTKNRHALADMFRRWGTVDNLNQQFLQTQGPTNLLTLEGANDQTAVFEKMAEYLKRSDIAENHAFCRLHQLLHKFTAVPHYQHLEGNPNMILPLLNLCLFRRNQLIKLHETLFNQFDYPIEYTMPPSFANLQDAKYREFYRCYLIEAFQAWADFVVEYKAINARKLEESNSTRNGRRKF